jgi:hypothetical protein
LRGVSYLKKKWTQKQKHFMKFKAFELAGVAVLASLQMAGAGDITGKITLQGTPPKAPEMPLKADQFCSALVSANKPMPWYVVGPGGELADVFVYLKSGAKPAEPSGQPAVLDQKNCEYTPYVIGLQTKQKLLVKNSDPVMHNVHPMPTAAGNKEVNRAQPPKGKDLEFTFDNPEVFLRFKCDVHLWMFAYVGVVDHPYFAVSGKDGTFKISNVPPGKYTIEAVHRKSHPDGKGVSKEITVEPGGAKVDFTVEAPKP